MSLNRIREKFDKVFIRYTDKSCEVLLIKGLTIFKGLSRCHENDNFDRKLGRTIALGRAEFAQKVDSGLRSSRKPKEQSRDENIKAVYSCEIIKLLTEEQVEQCIKDFLPKNRTQAS